MGKHIYKHMLIKQIPGSAYIGGGKGVHPVSGMQVKG